MKLAIVFLLFSIAVFSDAFVVKNPIPEEVAVRDISLLNLGVKYDWKEAIQVVYCFPTSNDTRIDEIIAKYKPYTLEVVNAKRLGVNRIGAVVNLRPNSTGEHEKLINLEFQHRDECSFGWIIVTP